MILRKAVVLSAVLSPLALFAQGCQSGGVGDPCVPEDEYQTGFSGFAASEVNLESRSFQCETRVCLVNHFRGRVTCPLGMDDKTLSDVKAGTTAPDAKGVCRIPGSTGKKAETVGVTVHPQCSDRSADRAVYCSCRCDGPDKDAKYCECPSGYECKPFKELDVGAAVAKGSSQLRGSYCVKENTAYATGQCETGRTVEETRTFVGSCTDKGNCKDADGKGITQNP